MVILLRLWIIKVKIKISWISIKIKVYTTVNPAKNFVHEYFIYFLLSSNMLLYIVCHNFFLDSFLFRRQRPCKMFPLVNVLWGNTNTIMWRLCFCLDKNTSCIAVFPNKCNTKRNIQWILPNFLFIIFIDQQLFNWNYGKF